MFTIKCKCGRTTMSFKKLTEKSFPDGWETDCCKEIEEKVVEPVTEKEVLEEVGSGIEDVVEVVEKLVKKVKDEKKADSGKDEDVDEVKKVRVLTKAEKKKLALQKAREKSE